MKGLEASLALAAKFRSDHGQAGSYQFVHRISTYKRARVHEWSSSPFVGQPEAGTPAGMSTRCGSCWISGIEREWQVFGGDIYPNRGRDTVYLNVTTDRLSCIALGMLSSQFRCNRAKAGGEDVVSDLRNHGVAFGLHYFEIGPPLRECAVALGNAM